MPLYCYYDPDTDERFELFMSIEEMLERGDDDAAIEHEGRYLRRDFVRETGGVINTAWSTPLESTAMGVHPDQVDDAIKDLKEKGIRGVEFTKDGNVKFASRGARRRYCESLGYVDRDAGYSDPQQDRQHHYGEVERRTDAAGYVDL